MCVPPSANAHHAGGRRPHSAVHRPDSVTAPDLLDRLQAALDRQHCPEDPAIYRLSQLGDLLRSWRIGRGYTRLHLAQKLSVDPELLLCLEHGLAEKADLDQEMLRRLWAMVSDLPADHPLIQTVEDLLMR